MKCISIDVFIEKTSEYREPVLLILDIYMDLLNHIKKYIEENNRLIIFDLKRNIFTKILNPLIYNPLNKFMGDKYTVAIYIDKPMETNKTNNIVRKEIETSISATTRLLGNRFPKPIALLLAEPIRLFKFAFIGLTGFFVNLLFIYIFYNIFIQIFTRQLSATLSSIMSFETSLTWNFVFHEYWTFRDIDLERNIVSRITRWLKFHVGSIGSFLSQVSIVTLLTGYLNQPLYLSLFIGVAIGMFINYLLGRTYAWGR